MPSDSMWAQQAQRGVWCLRWPEALCMCMDAPKSHAVMPFLHQCVIEA
jgi:hypothetical protein